MRLMLGLLILLTGCASPPVMLNRAVILNQTGAEIRDVSVRHEPTNKIGSVSAILPGRMFNLGFPSHPMIAERAIVSWRSGNGDLRTTEKTLPVADGHKNYNHVLVYTIHKNGTVTVKLEPQDKK